MSWLPRMTIDRTATLCLDNGEAEGPLVSIAWLGLILVIALYRRTRSVG